MKAVIWRELKNFLKNPLFWAGLLVALVGIYQNLEPYLGIHYFSDGELSPKPGAAVIDADITEGYIPAGEEKHRRLWEEAVARSLEQDFGMLAEEAEETMEKTRDMELEEAFVWLEENYRYYGAEYTYEDTAWYSGTAAECNAYIEEKLEKHPFSWYLSRKFADFAGLYMGFLATVLLAFVFYRDMRKKNYELLHTKPVRAWQYLGGKILGALAAMALILAVLTGVFMVLSRQTASASGFPMNYWDFPEAVLHYILPNMLMIICVYGAVSLVFRTPLPAVPLLFLYIIYSNMGKTGPDGTFNYYGRILAVIVRFPGEFFEISVPPVAELNQRLLPAVAVLLFLLSVRIWKRRRY